MTTDFTRSKVALLLLLFVGAAFVVYLPVLLPDDPLDYFGLVDTSLQFGPNLFYYDHALHVAREFPAWNPLILCGTPFAANPQSLAFYPPNMVRSVLNLSPTPLRTLVSFTVMVWLHILLAGAGAFLLARSHKLGAAPALAAAFAFSFSFMSLQSAQINPVFIMTASWLPWILLALNASMGAASPASTVKYALAGALAYGMCVLSGFSPYLPAISLGIAVFCATQWALSLFADRKPRGAVRGAGRTFLVAAVVGTVGASLAAAMLIPCAEFIAHSTRSADAAFFIEKRLPGLEVTHTPLHILSRLAYYAPVWGRFRPMGAGAGVALLCLMAVLHPRRRKALPYLVLLYLFVDSTIGPPFPIATVLQRLAPFQTSNPDYLAILCLAPVSLLAAFGLDALLRMNRDTPRPMSRVAYAALAVLLVAAAVHYGVSAPRFIEKKDQMMNTGTAMPVPPAALAAAAVAAVAVLLTIVFGKRRFLGVVVLAAVFTETFAASRDLVPFPTDRTNVLTLPEAVLEHARETPPFWPGDRRYGAQYWNALMYRSEATFSGYDPLHLESTFRLLVPESVETADDHRFIPPVLPPRTYPFLKRPFWLVPGFTRGPLPQRERPYPVTSSAFLESTGGSPRTPMELEALPEQWTSAHVERYPLEVRPAPDAKREESRISRVIFVSLPAPVHSVLHLRVKSLRHCRVLAEAAAADGLHIEPLGLRRVAPSDVAEDLFFPLPDWDRMEVAIEITGANESTEVVGAEVIQDMADEGRLINVLERSADRVRVSVDCPADRLLLVAEAAYPGWEATVDGKPAQILKANDAFMAVVLPAGLHDVTLEFRSRSLHRGVAVSLGTLAAALATLVIVQFAEKRRRSSAPEES